MLQVSLQQGANAAEKMASFLFLHFIEKPGKPLLGLGDWDSWDLAVAVSIQ
jgi:hypothetical protein